MLTTTAHPGSSTAPASSPAIGTSTATSTPLGLSAAMAADLAELDAIMATPTAQAQLQAIVQKQFGNIPTSKKFWQQARAAFHVNIPVTPINASGGADEG